MINPVALPGLFVTGTDTGVGKTVVAGAIADWFRRQGRRVAVLKPVATGCVRRREGVGGVMVPLDAKHSVLDLAKGLRLPAVVVARAGLGTINHTILTVEALRAAGVTVAGVVVNQYPAENAGIAEEGNPRAIEKWGRVPVLAIVPQEKIMGAVLPPGIVAAVEIVDWERFTRGGE